MIRVVAAVIEREGRFLICQRPAHKRHGRLWEFPGGKREENESDFETAQRELLEELGLEVVSVRSQLFEWHDSDSPFLIAFVPVEADGIPMCLEHEAAEWVRLSELHNYDLAPSDRQFVNHLVTAVGGKNE